MSFGVQDCCDRAASMAMGMGLGWLVLSRCEQWGGMLAWLMVMVGASVKLLLSALADKPARLG